MNGFVSYLIIFLAHLMGGGALILFGCFIIAGPFPVVRFDFSETQVLLWDALLSLLFFIQHSGTVRRSFRTWLLRAVPAHFYAAGYAVVSGVVLAGVVLFWQALPAVIIQVEGPLRWALRVAALLGVAGFIWGIRAFREFDPFGQQPIRSMLSGRQSRSPLFVVRGPFCWVRHPLYFFTLILLWAMPDLTDDRLLFNLFWSAWIVVGTCLEERDLVAEFGEKYRHYQKTVPMLLPWKGPVGRGV